MTDNIWVKATKLAATAQENLKRDIKLPALFVHKFGKADFEGAEGDVINVKRPPILRARDAGFRARNGLVVDKLIQSRIQIALTKHPYSRVALSPEERTLDEIDFVKMVQIPQVRALTEDFDESIAAALQNAAFVHQVSFNPGGTGWTSDPRKVASRARKLLNDSRVPQDGRYWLVGSAVAESIASYEKVTDVDASGLPEALREGVVTKLRGFWVIEIDTFDENESYFVHETAIAIAAVGPAVPSGAKGGASTAEGGLGVTQVFDYDSQTMADQSTVHAFTGATPVLDPKVWASDGTSNGVTHRKGEIVLDAEGEIVLEFVRAVKVNFTPADESSSGSGSSAAVESSSADDESSSSTSSSAG